MSNNLPHLLEVDERLTNAMHELRQQHSLINEIATRQTSYHALLALLSNALRQFSWLEKQRKTLVIKIAAERSFKK